MIQIKEKENCCGCTACYSVCPQKAIEMQQDREGFKYPQVIIDKCTNCNLCERVCPELSHDAVNTCPSVKYAVQNNDQTERKESTAGGFFSIIANHVIESENGIVFAAGYDGCTVIHKSACEKSSLAEMRGSKYVQSDLRNVFSQVKLQLQQGKLCLFVGTPCQVYGIKNYLDSKLCDNLITVDLLCLGVSSPKIYQEWIEFLQLKYHSKVKRVYFRDKSYGYSTSNIRVDFENQKRLEQKYDAKSLLKMFFAGYNMRPSCYDCSFRTIDRVSDFTIGDFHQIAQYHPEMDDDKGTTVVWTHSERALALMTELQENMCCKIIEDSCSNTLDSRSKLTSVPHNREEFFDDVNKLTYSQLTQKWAKESLRGALANTLKPIINKTPLRKVIFKFIKKNKQKKFQQRVAQANTSEGEK